MAKVTQQVTESRLVPRPVMFCGARLPEATFSVIFLVISWGREREENS